MPFISDLKKIMPEFVWNAAAAVKREYLKYKYLKGERKAYPAESSKAKSRRLKESFFEKYCQGEGLDIGFGGDPLLENIRGWDFEHGDAHFLEGIKDEEFDFVYSSHTLEHMIDPHAALRNWFRVVKKGGFLILYIPHRDLYEKKITLPSKFNPTHKSFFLLDKDEKPDTLGIIPLIESALRNFQIIYAKECSNGYKPNSPDMQAEGEYSIEVVIKKTG